MEVNKSQNYSNVQEINTDLESVFYACKEKIDTIIGSHYGEKKIDNIFELFKSTGIELSNRNNDFLSLLNDKYGLDFINKFDFSGGIKITENEINSLNNTGFKNFFTEGNTRKDGENVNSRGYNYYFNLNGFENIDNSNLTLNPELYFNNLFEYFNEIFSLLNEFNGKKIDDLDDLNKKVLTILIEHYKNILMFFKNLLIIFESKENIVNLFFKKNNKMFDNYYHYDLFENNNIATENIGLELEKSINIFSDLILNIENKDIIDFINPLDSEIFDYFKSFFTKSYEKQSAGIKRLQNKKQNNQKLTDINGEKKYIRKTNTKVIGSLIRIIREEDNPVKQLLSAHNLSRKIPKETKNIDINGLLYGGIESPYFMKYILRTFYGYDENSININHFTISNYHSRNLKKVSNISNYPNDVNLNDSNLQVLLDDNMFNGTTINHSEHLISDLGPILTGVTEVGLRRSKLGKLDEGSNLQSLLSKISYSASVTPIEKNSGHYINMVTKKIRKKLPGIVGKL